ncbi:MAG TPA: 4Fe-4S double cluster binding domain-containing protein [Methanocella sp.]|nr:4Fe-4S double cluster binding domain-containing protein [Methanocella sp.]
MGSDLLRQLEERGYAGRIVPVERLADLREDIEALRRDGLLDDFLYREYLSNFVFGPPADMPDARSLIIVAARQPQYRFTFAWKGKAVAAVVPPTYLHAGVSDQAVERTLTELLAPGGYRIAPAVLPKKPLAVHSGLATYGRNNVTYVPGFGSFHRLTAFFSSMDAGGDEWHELRMMDRCVKCRLCHTLCPTGAIAEDRFQLHAERCIVYHNEKPGTEPFPAWMDPAGHNCLIGCMACQRACPENAGPARQFEEGCSFSEEETGLLLAGTPPAQLPATLAEKLKTSDLLSQLDTVPRNLRALIHETIA